MEPKRIGLKRKATAFLTGCFIFFFIISGIPSYAFAADSGTENNFENTDYPVDLFSLLPPDSPVSAENLENVGGISSE